MRRAVLFPMFFLVLAISAAALYYAQRSEKASHVSANAILELAADAQRDLARVPLRLTRISDEEEIAIGKKLGAQYVSINQPLSSEQTALQAYVRRMRTGRCHTNFTSFPTPISSTRLPCLVGRCTSAKE